MEMFYVFTLQKYRFGVPIVIEVCSFASGENF
jgi:hypothetical protein